MGSLGVPEMIAIFVVALVLFGPKKLPELGRTLGKAISEFRRASNELKTTFEREMHSLEAEHESLKEATRDFQNELYSPDYDSPYYDAAAYSPEPYETTASDPSTVGASATEGAESANSAAAHEAVPPVAGTVPRKSGTELAAAQEPIPLHEAPSEAENRTLVPESSDAQKS